MTFILPETELLKIKTEKKESFQASLVFEPLAPGYGLTVGHALRRVLLSSLAGAAITDVRIEGATHEFATLSGIKEDIIEIILNLKSLRLKLIGDESAKLKISQKGPGVVTAGDFEKNSRVEIIHPKHHIATLDKKGKFSMEATVKAGLGYEPVETRQEAKPPLGTIALDAVFTPVKKIHYNVENTRVGERTDFDRLTLDITTDETIDPVEAVKRSAQILVDHFALIYGIKEEKAGKKPIKKAVKKQPPSAKAMGGKGKRSKIVKKLAAKTKAQSKTKTSKKVKSKRK